MVETRFELSWSGSEVHILTPLNTFIAAAIKEVNRDMTEDNWGREKKYHLKIRLSKK